MKTVKGSIVIGNIHRIGNFDVYSVEEAKEILKNKNWEIGTCIFDAEVRNKPIGWLAEYAGTHGDGIFVECKEKKTR